MDQLSALKYIFKQYLYESNGMIVIKYQNNEYEINPENLEIMNPRFQYIDVYDYILKDSKSIKSTNAESTGEIAYTIEDVQKMTEEQFFEWKRGFVEEQEDDIRPTGRQIWLSNSVDLNVD